MMKLPHTEVKFYPEVKSQTGLSSLRVSCKRALRFCWPNSLKLVLAKNFIDIKKNWEYVKYILASYNSIRVDFKYQPDKLKAFWEYDIQK